MPLVPTINLLRRLNSGEYGDKYTTLAPTASIISSTPSTLCTLRLSITTTAPFHNLGASSYCTNFKNSSPFIDFPIVFIAISFFWLIAPTTVTLLPLENGFISSTLSPFILLDLPLIIPSNTPISSKNTRLCGANFLIFPNILSAAFLYFLYRLCCCVGCFFTVSFCFCRNLHIALSLNLTSVLSCQYSQYSANV